MRLPKNTGFIPMVMLVYWSGDEAFRFDLEDGFGNQKELAFFAGCFASADAEADAR